MQNSSVAHNVRRLAVLKYKAAVTSAAIEVGRHFNRVAERLEQEGEPWLAQIIREQWTVEERRLTMLIRKGWSTEAFNRIKFLLDNGLGTLMEPARQATALPPAQQDYEALVAALED